MLGENLCLVKNYWENRDMNLPSESENERIAQDESGKHDLRLERRFLLPEEIWYNQFQILSHKVLRGS